MNAAQLKEVGTEPNEAADWMANYYSNLYNVY